QVLEPWPSPWVVPLKEGSAEGPGSGRISGQLRGPEHLCSSLQGKEGLCIEGSVLTRLLRCFTDGKSFGLTLRLWDVLILEGERVLTAMVHTSFKIHRKCLMKLSWSTIWKFQEQLSQSWALEDNTVLRNLQASMKELTKKHWDLPPPAELGQWSSRVSPGIGPLHDGDRLAVPTPPAQLQEFMPSVPLGQKPCPLPAWPNGAVPKAQAELHTDLHVGGPGASQEPRAAGCSLGCPEVQDDGSLSPGEVRLCITRKHLSRNSTPQLHTDPHVGGPCFLCCHFEHGSWDSVSYISSVDSSPGTTRRTPPSEPTGTTTPGPAWVYDREEALREIPLQQGVPC
ncbi:hypothetical protein H8958_005247, partial [Nasalis larvatus]